MKSVSADSEKEPLFSRRGFLQRSPGEEAGAVLLSPAYFYS